jgi:type I restriction enzyme, S subunit
MKAGWQTEKLGEVCSFLNRGISPKYIETNGICVLNQKCIRDHRISYELARRHDFSAKSVAGERLIRLGDVLVNSTGTGTLGRVAQVREAPEEPTTVDSHVTIVRPKEGKFYQDFFGYMLILIEEAIKESGEGCGGQTELARSILAEKFSVSYPTSIDQQQRIVAILDQAFEAIAKARANAEQNLQNVRALFESHLQSVFNQGGDGWVDTKLGEVCDLFQGLCINAKTKHLLVENSSLPLLRIKDLRDNSAELFIAETGWPKNSYVNESEIIYTRTGQIGLVFRGRVGVLHNNCFKVTPKPALNEDYLFWWLQNPVFRARITVLASKTAQPDITHLLFKAQPIIVPPRSYQDRVIDKIKRMREETQRLEALYQRKIACLDELKKSLLQQAFAGEL